MGYYINQLPNGETLPSLGKAEALLKIEGACELKGTPTTWEEDLVCVVNNGPFEAAAYAFSDGEMKEFAAPDRRPKRWLKIPGAKEMAK